MQIEIIEKSYGTRKILGPITLDIAANERIALLGPSGIGKSTLIRILAGLDIKFNGHIAAPCKFAMVFQEPTLLPWRNATDNITQTTRCTASVATNLLREVGLETRENAYPRQLSLGQQRRLALARALAANPDMLLLDEAFASLDKDTANRMHTLTKNLLDARNMGMVLATHDLDEARKLATRIVVINGPPATIKFDQRLQNTSDTTPNDIMAALQNT